MDFRSTATTLKASGYPPRKADAKIAHDIVLKASSRIVVTHEAASPRPTTRWDELLVVK